MKSMMKEDKVSIIMVAWNNEGTIGNCISSIFQYTHCNFELVIVDNASSDNTCSIIESFHKDSIKLIKSQNNLGFSKANNFALQHCSGNYIFYLNPDVIFTEEIVLHLASALSDPQVGMTAPRLLNPDKTLQVSYSNFSVGLALLGERLYFGKLLPNKWRRRYFQSYYHSNLNREVDWVIGAAQMCRRQDVENIGGYPTEYFMYGEDADFCLSIRKLGMKVMYMADISMIHIGGYSEQQVINSSKVEKGVLARLNITQKYYGKTKKNQAAIIMKVTAHIKLGVLKALRTLMTKEIIDIKIGVCKKEIEALKM